MRPSKEFRHEVDSDFSEASYVGRKILIWVVCVIAVLGVIGLGFKFVGTNADRIIFKQSITYNEGMLDDLAEYRYEYYATDDEIERAAIADLVNSRFANFDRSKIENYDLVQFLDVCSKP